jgi:nitroreductase
MTMAFLDLAAARYSVRKFKPQAVPQEALEQLLEAARLAPTACNNQPQRIKVITAPKDLAKVDACTPYRFGAPLVLLVCCDRSVCWKRPFDSARSDDVDASIVTTHMMLAAQDVGLGSCWVMYFDPAKTSALFALPEHIVPVAMLPIGYPAEDAAPAPQHGARLALEELLLQ